MALDVESKPAPLNPKGAAPGGLRRRSATVISQQGIPSRRITGEETIKLKLVCDMYLSVRVRRLVSHAIHNRADPMEQD